MAKIRPGGIVGQIRGSIGGDTFSQNRYGAYVRTRAIPTVVRTEYTDRVRGSFATASMFWKSLSSAKQLDWKNWAANNPVIDRFGEAQILSGNAAFIMLNARKLIIGQSISEIPPGKAAPPALENVGLANMAENIIELQTEPNILDNDKAIMIYGWVTSSEGMTYVENRFRLLGVNMKLTADPINVYPLLAARYGTIQKLEIVHIKMIVVSYEDGQISTPQRIMLVYNYT